MCDQPRVAITGIGVVSPFGVGRDALLGSHLARRERHARDHRVRHGASDRAASPRAGAGRRAATPATRRRRSAARTAANGNGRADPRRYAKVSRIAVLAAREALQDAGLDRRSPDLGVIVGSGAGGIDVAERQYGDFYCRRATTASRPMRFRSRSSASSRARSRSRSACAASSHVLSTGCTSSTDAIGYAAALIRHGEADAVAHRRRRRVRDARHDLRVRPHARRRHALQRPARPRPRGRSTATATASCSAKAPGC